LHILRVCRSFTL